MELIPSIANYFGVSIDELFGYRSDRAQRIDALTAQIYAMNAQNNGSDVNLSECLALARNAAAEFPGNDAILLCLASVLQNAGYVRHGEHHRTDEEGYDRCDAALNRTCTEWREAVVLYETLLKRMEEGDARRRAVRELLQLYRNLGESEKALALLDSTATLADSRELLKTRALDGKAGAQACGEALLQTSRIAAELTVQAVLAQENTLTAQEKAQSLDGAARLFEAVCPDGNCGPHHAFLARVATLQSFYLWSAGEQDDAFSALEQANLHFHRYRSVCASENAAYTAPLLRLVTPNLPASTTPPSAMSLAEDWPWWCVPGRARVRAEMQADPRWDAWLTALQS